jgi:hypothetical protein
MTHKKNLMMLGVVLMATLMVSSIFVNAKMLEQKQIIVSSKSIVAQSTGPVKAVSIKANSVQLKTNLQSVIPRQHEDDLELVELEDVDINEYVKEYEALPDAEIPNVPKRCFWIVWARGFSWKRNDIPTVEEANEGRIPMGMKLAVRPIWRTEEWTLYKIFRGTISHDEETYQVEGYALKKSNGRFYLSLRGEDNIEIEAVGKVYPPKRNTDSARRFWRFHRIAMKGRLYINDDIYAFALRGYAFRVCLHVVEPSVKVEETITTTVS